MPYIVSAIQSGSLSFQLLESIRNICLRDDCISLKYAASAPAADLHNDAFRDPSAAKITSGSAAQIMEEKPRYAVTSHSSQGQTADRVLIHVDSEQAHGELLNSRMA